MAYVTATQIASMFPGVSFGASTKITSDEIAEWIAEADQEIDSRVGLKYEVPITNATDLLVLRTIARKLVGQMVRETLNIKTPSEETKQGGQSNMAKEARLMLKDIVDGQIKLPNSTLLSEGDGVKSFNVDCDVEHTFQRGVDQW